MQITAAMVKELRERTGAGMMECKKALVEAEWNQTRAAKALKLKRSRRYANNAKRSSACKPPPRKNAVLENKV